MIKKWCKKINHENYSERYEDFENRIFSLTAWTIGIATLLVSALIGSSIYQGVLDKKAIKTLEEADKNNQLLTNIALAATPAERVQAASEAIDFDNDNSKLYLYRANVNMDYAYNGMDPMQSLTANQEVANSIYKNSPYLNFAYEDCEKAISLDKHCLEAYYMQGVIKFSQEDYGTASDCFEKYDTYNKALKNVNSDNISLCLYWGFCKYKMGDYPGCIEKLTKIPDEILEMTGRNIYDVKSTPFYLIADSFEHKGDNDNAILWFDKILYTAFIDDYEIVCQRIIDIYIKDGDINKKSEYEEYKNYVKEYNKKPQKYQAK